MSGGGKSGNSVLESEMKDISTILHSLGVDMRRELRALDLPSERPLIVPPPIEFKRMIEKVGIESFFDECKKKYLDGYFKDSVRLSFEKIEKLVMDKTKLTDIGKKINVLCI